MGVIYNFRDYEYPEGCGIVNLCWQSSPEDGGHHAESSVPKSHQSGVDGE